MSLSNLPRTAIKLLAVPQTYAELRRSVEAVLFAGRRDIEAAWVRTYHETGRLIHEHLLLNKDRADYGAKVFSDWPRTPGSAAARCTNVFSSTAVSQLCDRSHNSPGRITGCSAKWRPSRSAKR